ncbi:MAG TPA: hypothetical protein ENI81_02885, partial [Phycisphaerales bacterium]|nr:hypothetical protein [Phycisphaerales bacterium]
MLVAKQLRACHALSMTFILVALGSLACARIIYVDDDATGANNGTSWRDAYTYLTYALIDAASGDEIRVARGTYRPSQGLAAIPEFDWRTTTFELTDGLTLKGGYAGYGETDPNTQDPGLFETILSGDLNGDDVEVADPFDLAAEPTRADNSYHVVTITGPAVLEAVTIAGGHADNPNEPIGAGLRATGDGVTIRDCAFGSNFAVDGGGGLYSHNVDLLLEGCAFYRNAATSDKGQGGGLKLNEAGAELVNCVFSENRAARGGAIHSSGPRYLDVINCLMTANIARQGGGVFYSEGGFVSAQNCTAVANGAAEGCFLMDVTAPVRGKPAPWIEVNSCILADGGNEISNSSAALTIKYTDIVAGSSAVSDPHRSVVWGPGNIEAYPLFAAPGYWADVHDPNLAVEPNDANAVWIEGDYHPQSKAGRYDP